MLVIMIQTNYNENIALLPAGPLLITQDLRDTSPVYLHCFLCLYQSTVS